MPQLVPGVDRGGIHAGHPRGPVVWIATVTTVWAATAWGMGYGTQGHGAVSLRAGQAGLALQ